MPNFGSFSNLFAYAEIRFLNSAVLLSCRTLNCCMKMASMVKIHNRIAFGYAIFIISLLTGFFVMSLPYFAELQTRNNMREATNSTWTEGSCSRADNTTIPLAFTTNWSLLLYHSLCYSPGRAGGRRRGKKLHIASLIAISIFSIHSPAM